MGIFIKVRIIIGCIGVGYFMTTAIQSGNSREIIGTGFIAMLVVYGVVMLQNKYFSVKE